jgi:hypothetical protein
LRRYLSPRVLILDDFAMREYTVLQTEDLYELVSRRYRRGSLNVTTNRAMQDLYPLFPNQVLAESLLDRLLNSAYVLTLLGRSYRRRQRPAASDPGGEGGTLLSAHIGVTGTGEGRERTACAVQGLRRALHRRPLRAGTDVGVLRPLPGGAEARAGPCTDAGTPRASPRGRRLRWHAWLHIAVLCRRRKEEEGTPADRHGRQETANEG